MMNYHRTRGKLLGEGAKLRPTFATFYNLGVEYSKGLPALRTFREVGQNLGINHRLVQTIQYVALGKVVYRLREQLGGEASPNSTQRRRGAEVAK